MANYNDDNFSFPIKRASGTVEIVRFGAAGNVVTKDPVTEAQALLIASGWREAREEVRARFLAGIIAVLSKRAEATAFLADCVKQESEGGFGMEESVIKKIHAALGGEIPVAPVTTPAARVFVKDPEPPTILPAIVSQQLPDASPSVPVAPVKKNVPPQPPSRERLREAATKLNQTLPPKQKVGLEPAAVILHTPSSAKAAEGKTPLPANRDEAIAQLINEILTEAHLSGREQLIEDRLRFALASRLREIRKEDETRELLARPVQSGGVGLTVGEVTRIMELLESRALRITTELLTQQKQRVHDALAEEKSRTTMRQEQRTAQVHSETEAIFEAVTGARPMRPFLSSRPQKNTTVAAPVASAVLRAMTDVRPPVSERSLVGPVEELRRLTIDDFRSFSPDPQESTRRIQDKVRLLSDIGFAERVAGIHALKESPLLSLYHTIIRNAVGKSRALETVMADRHGEHLPTLTKEEFSAILSLNETLQYY